MGLAVPLPKNPILRSRTFGPLASALARQRPAVNACHFNHYTAYSVPPQRRIPAQRQSLIRQESSQVDGTRPLLWFRAYLAAKMHSACSLTHESLDPTGDYRSTGPVHLDSLDKNPRYAYAPQTL